MDITSAPVGVAELHSDIGVRHAEFEQVRGADEEVHLWTTESLRTRRQ